MTHTPQDGGPAFPPTVGPNGEIGDGMSLRDWFAGQALAGIMSNPCSWTDDDGVLRFAENAYAKADAMIAERNKL